MQSKRYEIRDNGVRSFVPPCFNWELTDLESRTVTTASMLDLSSVTKSANEVERILRDFAKGGEQVVGHVTTDNDNTDGVGHVVFKVDNIIHGSSQSK